MMTWSPYWLWYRDDSERSDVPVSAEANWIYYSVKERLERMFNGYRWLRRAIPETETHAASVDIRPRLASVGAPTTTSMERRSIHGRYAAFTDDEAEDLVCEVDLPATWFDQPADGLLAMRILLAGLVVVQDVGRELAIGMPKVRQPTASVLAMLERPFDITTPTDPAQRPESLHVLRRLESSPPGSVVLVARSDARGQQQAC
jgi:hypothetical protein